MFKLNKWNRNVSEKKKINIWISRSNEIESILEASHEFIAFN